MVFNILFFFRFFFKLLELYIIEIFYIVIYKVKVKDDWYVSLRLFMKMNVN